jgi:hypothetical protein
MMAFPASSIPITERDLDDPVEIVPLRDDDDKDDDTTDEEDDN